MEDTPELMSVGYVAAFFQTSPREVSLLADAAGVNPAVVVDDVTYYRAEGVAKMLGKAKASKLGRWAEGRQ